MTMKCVFCLQTNINLFLFGSVYACKNCVEVTNQLVNVEGLSPSNDIEQALLSLIYFLESDLVSTRNILSSHTNTSILSKSIKSKMDKLAEAEINHDGVNPIFLKRVNKIVQEHRVLLSIYL